MMLVWRAAMSKHSGWNRQEYSTGHGPQVKDQSLCSDGNGGDCSEDGVDRPP